MRTITLIAALLVSAAVAAPALAAQDETVVQRVHTADLDLASAQGQATLRSRIGRALEGACGSYAQTDAAEQDRISACRASIKAGIDRQLAGLKGAAYATASNR
jgi:UrcA family protein